MTPDTARTAAEIVAELRSSPVGKALCKQAADFIESSLRPAAQTNGDGEFKPVNDKQKAAYDYYRGGGTRGDMFVHYKRGKAGIMCPTEYGKDGPAYAAWMAGRDDARKEATPSAADPIADTARVGEELKREWRDGPPPKPWSEEWFIAETTFRDRVVLKALPEEWTYDFKTADDTYIKADKIKRWMQFPDSIYIAPSPVTDETALSGEVAGWLIEENFGGAIHWIALTEETWPQHEVIRHGDDFDVTHNNSPIRRVKNANDALRFARKEDAEAFIKLVERFAFKLSATEHAWIAALASTPQPAVAEDRGLPPSIAELIEAEKERLRAEIRSCTEGMETSSDPWWYEDRDRAKHRLRILEEAEAAIRQGQNEEGR